MTQRQPTQFWCNVCEKWTKVAGTRKDFYCSRCGEPYSCGDCGFDIDRMGNCQRFSVMGEHCESEVRS